MPRRASSVLTPLTLLSLVAVALAACGDSSSTSPNNRVPSQIQKIAGDMQEVAAGTAVGTAPSVRVRDASNRPVAGATVTFEVASGGGTITGAQQTTDQNGVATVGSWTLGATPGQNTLRASVGTVTPELFTATGVSPCAAFTELAFGTTITASLSESDCTSGGGFLSDLYRFTVPQGVGAIRVNQASPEIDALLLMYNAQERLVAVSDDSFPPNPNPLPHNTNASIRVLVDPGVFSLEATSYDPGETGSYTLSTASTTESITGCTHQLLGEEVFIAHGTTTTQAVSTADCAIPAEGGAVYHGDRFLVLLSAGQTVTIRMSPSGSNPVDPYLILANVTNPDVAAPVLDEDDDSGGGNSALIAYTADEFMALLIDAGTSETGETGGYTLSVQTTPAAAQAMVSGGSPLVTPAPADRRSLQAGWPFGKSGIAATRVGDPGERR